MKKLFLFSLTENIIDRFIERLPQAPELTTVAFIPTAADPYEDKWFVEADRKSWIDHKFNLVEVDLKGKTPSQLETELENKHIIHIAGGNSFYLLQKVRESGFDQVLGRLLDRGVIYSGGSAGAVLAGPNIEPVKTFDDPSVALGLNSFEGLGLVDFVVLPHYGKEKYMSKYQAVVDEYSSRFKLITLTDFQMIVVEGEDYKIL